MEAMESVVYETRSQPEAFGARAAGPLTLDQSIESARLAIWWHRTYVLDTADCTRSEFERSSRVTSDCQHQLLLCMKSIYEAGAPLREACDRTGVAYWQAAEFLSAKITIREADRDFARLGF